MYVNIYVCSFWVEKKNGIDDLGVINMCINMCMYER